MRSELTKSDGDELLAGDVLTPKERAFVDAYGDPESPTYSRGTASAEAAGFVQPHSASWKLRRRPRVARALEVYQEASRAAVGKVLSDLENTRLRALADGSAAGLSVAAQCSRLMGAHLGMFFERSVIGLDMPGHEEYDERVAVEAHRLAQIALERAGAAGLGSPVIDVEAAPAGMGLPEPKPEPERK